ncbi:MAG: hypothetical protein LBJ46_01605 [Planctomycetota bacterium]|jgi:hypothetical protein|nr:hypothetical protein [Planctomycetota bacterium]
MVFPDRALFLVARFLLWFGCALVVVVCWQAAGLAWRLLAPATGGPMPLPPQSAPVGGESRDALAGWFEVETRIDAPTASDYALMAVIAGRNDGVAVLKGGDGKGLAVRTGDAVDAGSRLVSVDPGGATLERDGMRQEIKLPRADAPPVASNAEARAPTPGVPAAPAANAIRLTHGQMLGVMRGGNVAGWDRGLSNAPDGGIRIDRVAAQPFAPLLQLQDGDVLKKVNQRPLGQLADISLVFFHFGQNSSVVLELIRRGVPMTLRYEIQP